MLIVALFLYRDAAKVVMCTFDLYFKLLLLPFVITAASIVVLSLLLRLNAQAEADYCIDCGGAVAAESSFIWCRWLPRYIRCLILILVLVPAAMAPLLFL